MADIFIAGLLAEPARQSRTAKSDAAVATPNRERRLVAASAVGRQAKRRA